MNQQLERIAELNRNFNDLGEDLVLLEAVRGGRPRMTVEKPLIVFREPGVYMPEIREIYGY